MNPTIDLNLTPLLFQQLGLSAKPFLHGCQRPTTEVNAPLKTNSARKGKISSKARLPNIRVKGTISCNGINAYSRKSHKVTTHVLAINFLATVSTARDHTCDQTRHSLAILIGLLLLKSGNE